MFPSKLDSFVPIYPLKKFLHDESIYDLILHKCLVFASIIRSIHFAYVANFEWHFYPFKA